jgi:hypothetical protein
VRGLIDIRATGARVKLISDGDVAAGLMAAMEGRTGIDVLMGIGGAPERVLTACAIKAVGGGMQARLALRSEAERLYGVHNMTRLRALGASGRARMRPLASDLMAAPPKGGRAGAGLASGLLPPCIWPAVAGETTMLRSRALRWNALREDRP